MKDANFHHYLVELSTLYRERQTLNSISIIARKYHIKALSKQAFFEYGLDKQVPTFERSCQIRRHFLDEEVRRRNRRIAMQEAAGASMPPVIRQLMEGAPGLPDGMRIIPLSPTDKMPYRYALASDCAIDNADEYMCSRIMCRAELVSELGRQLSEHILEYMEFRIPTLCCLDELIEHTIGFAKSSHNGCSYWLSDSLASLVLLAWVAYDRG